MHRYGGKNVNMSIRDRNRFPRIGKRILKSAIGVVLCYLVQRLREGNGIVFYSQLAVLWCIQPFVKDSLKNGIQRTIGTMVGAFFGLIVLQVSLYVAPGIFSHDGMYAILVGFGVLFTIYTTVLLKRKNASYFSAVVFLSIVVNHIGDSRPYLFVWNRVLDTMIGIGLGVAINMFRLPRKKQQDILFVSGIDDTLLNKKEELSDYSRVEINRMLQEGANFTVSTMRTPASVIDVLNGIQWRIPLIVMDGAALYDMKEREYVKTVPLEPVLVKHLKSFFEAWEMNCFINVVLDGVLVICYQELQTETEQMIFKTLRRSPYRNFVKKDLSEEGESLYFMAVDQKEKMDLVYEGLSNQEWFSELKVQYYPSDDYPGQMYLKIYNREATRENMIEALKCYTGLEKVLTFGSIENRYDIVIGEHETDVVAGTLERVYEPLFWKKPEDSCYSGVRV